MNTRERFQKVMHFQQPDRPPFSEFLGFWDETTNRWHGEGLPWGTGPDEYFGFDAGLTPSRNVYVPSFTNVGEIRIARELIPIDFGPIPRFRPTTLEEDERQKIIVDGAGITKKIMKRSTSIPSFVDFPVKTPDDFETMKTKYDPNEPRRYPALWSDEIKEYYRALNRPVGIFFPGFFGQGRNFLGLEGLLVSFHRNPEFIGEMMDFWANFIIKTIAPAVEATKIDYAMFWEDMCYKNGPFISPKLFKEIMVPYYKRVTRYLRDHGIDIILVDTDGNHAPLTALFIEAGVNGLLPLEVQAGMSAIDQRQEHGRKLLLIGNIDKRALIRGRASIDKELGAKLPALLEQGGYIPCLDHLVPADVSFENYVYYIKQLRNYLGIQSGDA